ncbi:MAG: exo-beta-N-acetylmuramidase NamZ domain-containing protein, partial [Candidatus Acidiferrales bacterium]
LVGHRGRVIYRKAYGSRALIPKREPMTADTIFDLASLTKLVATTPAVMKLVEQGKLRLNDPVARTIPEFGAHGKDQITLRQVLTHTSGLRPDPPVGDAPIGTEAMLKLIYDDTLISPPGMRFIYSDTGFIVLGELVRRAGGLPLNVFAEQNIFLPLGMKHTRFLPSAAWLPKIAPTEEIDLPEGAKAGSGRGRLLRGVVHDPRSRAMGGVAGHAGLFSTVDDLSIFCQMMLDEGRILPGPGAKADRRIFADSTVLEMTSPQSPPWSPSLRGLGWDIDTSYSSPRGELFPVGSYGHTGFTGTSIWIDPASRTYVILLTNSVHPYGRPAISSLRARVATAVAASLNAGKRNGFTSPLERSAGAVGREYDAAGVYYRSDQTKTGIDVLEAENFASLKGKNVGLITNQTGIDTAGRRTIDLLTHAPGMKLAAIFSPEHGITGNADQEKIASTTDEATGLPIYSLYGEARRPTDAMMRGLDALVFDIQDAGVRFYTYISTMGYALEVAAANNIPFYVLDRPNPLGGEVIEGPMLDRNRINFVAYFPMPVRYGMTIGELAQMFKGENKLTVDLHVIAMKDWHRRDLFGATGLYWIPPSPNLRSLDASILYPGIEILQAAGVSVGRGTDTPFELLGAPWIHGPELARELNSRFIPGVRFVPTRFTPSAGIYYNSLCEGVALVITDRSSVNSMLMGLEIASALNKLYPKQFVLEN